MHPNVNSVSLEVKSEPKNWKDQAAGYKQWNVTYKMTDGRTIIETVSGTREEVKHACETYGPDAD